MPKQRSTGGGSKNEAKRPYNNSKGKAPDTRTPLPKDTTSCKRDAKMEAVKPSAKSVSKTENPPLLPVRSTNSRDEVGTFRKTYAEVVAEVDSSSSSKAKGDTPLSAPPSQSELNHWEMVAEACAGVLNKLDIQGDDDGSVSTGKPVADFEFEDWLLCYDPNSAGRNDWELEEEEEEEDWIYVNDVAVQCCLDNNYKLP